MNKGLIFLYLSFLGLHSWYTEVPRPGVQLELWPPAYATATGTWDPSRICDLHHSSRQCWILNPLSKARDQIYNLMVPSRISFCCTTTRELRGLEFWCQVLTRVLRNVTSLLPWPGGPTVVAGEAGFSLLPAWCLVSSTGSGRTMSGQGGDPSDVLGTHL